MEKNIKQIILDALLDITHTIYHDHSNIELVIPTNLTYGDLTTNIAFHLAKIASDSPYQLATDIKERLEKKSILGIKEIRVLKPGFINFWLSSELLLFDLSQNINTQGHSIYGNYYNEKKIIIEFTDPNPFKEFHIGHLYDNIVGESLARLLESQKAQVKRVCYQGDKGMHVAKSIWGMYALGEYMPEDLASVESKASFLGKAYAKGSTAYEQDVNAKQEIIEINKKIYAEDPSITDIYQKGRRWSLEYFDTIYKKLGMKFDALYFESDTGTLGLEIVKRNIKNGIFEESEGAIVFKGEKYNLHTRVFINKYGIPTYEAKELGLAPHKYKDFPYDQSIIVTGNEVKDYFKVLLKVIDLLFPTLRNKTLHISHGMVRLPEGKMSSRTGNVITARAFIESILLKTKEKLMELNKNDEASKEKYSELFLYDIALSAIKYSLLKNNIGKDIEFNSQQAISFEGNSAPYLQYTYVRLNAILAKSNIKISSEIFVDQNTISLLEEEDVVFLRLLFTAHEIMTKAAQELAPHVVCEYLFILAKYVNLYYQKVNVLNTKNNLLLQARLSLVAGAANVFNKGFYLVGIAPIERM